MVGIVRLVFGLALFLECSGAFGASCDFPDRWTHEASLKNASRVIACASSGQEVELGGQHAPSPDEISWPSVGKVRGLALRLSLASPNEIFVVNELASKSGNRFVADIICDQLSQVLAKARRACPFRSFYALTGADAFNFYFRGDPRDYNLPLIEASLDFSHSELRELVVRNDRDPLLATELRVSNNKIERITFNNVIFLGDVTFDANSSTNFFYLNRVVVTGNLTITNNYADSFAIENSFVLGTVRIEGNRFGKSFLQDDWFTHVSIGTNQWGVDQHYLTYMLKQVSD